MKKETMKSNDPGLLRQKAEEKLKKKKNAKTKPLTEIDTLKLLHELEVHQIELEMQNEELQEAIDKAKTAEEKYTALYDFAFTGYFTLDPNGKIRELNLTGAKMLGKERSNLINRNFKDFVTMDTKASFNDFFQKMFETNSKETTEVRLIVAGNPSIYVNLEGIVSFDEQKCLLTAFDFTKRKHAEEILKLKANELEQFNYLMTTSELQMKKLKLEINNLLKRLGEKEKFSNDSVSIV